MTDDTTYILVDAEHNTWRCDACGHLTAFEADGPFENDWCVCPHCARVISGEMSMA